MSSSDEILSYLDDPCRLASFLKENCQSILPDSTYIHIAKHFLCQPISIEGLSVLRNLYGRSRSSSLDQSEMDLLIFNIKECLNSNSDQLIKPFLQYLHNINRLLPNDYRDLAYLCSLIVLKTENKNIIACIISAYLDNDILDNPRFDLIINGLYKNEDENEDNPWIDQLTKILIDKDKQWLRKYYLDKIYTKELLNAIDTFDKEKIFNIQTIKQDTEQIHPPTIKKIDLSGASSLNDIHKTLSSYITNSISIETIDELSLIHLFSSLINYPDDIHILFSCLLLSVINPSNYSKLDLNLFRNLINLLTNYYVNQQDLLDDNRYRLTTVYLLSKYICEIHRRRLNNEHEWYHLYRDIPKEHPLPTFDLFSDILCLLATLTYNNIECQNQVREVCGTIESILSMTQIDINQPKSQACVTWLLKCLTEHNEENRNYIKQIK